MSAAAPWSVKGIDPKAREIAKDLARRSGMTLGEWLNTMILEDGEEDDSVQPLPRRPHVAEMFERRGRARRLDDAYGGADDLLQHVAASVDAIAARLEAAEQRSTIAIQGVDQAVSGLVRRLDGQDAQSAVHARRIDDIAEELREGHRRLRRFEQDTGPRTDESFGKVESAIGALSSRLYDIEERQRTGVNELRERMDAVEKAAGPGPGAEVLAAVGGRLDEAQARTTEALRSLERSFADLDRRMRQAEGQVEPTTAREAARFEKLAETLARQVEGSRAEMMRRLDSVEAGNRMERLERAVAAVGQQVEASERRGAGAVEAMGREVLRIAQNLNGRMQRIESGEGLEKFGRELGERVDRDLGRLSESVDQRLLRAQDQHALALEKLGGEITRISDRLTDRIAQSERRSAQALDDIGERLTRSSEKIEQRYDHASGELAERMRQSEERTARLLAEARESIAQRSPARRDAVEDEVVDDWPADAFPGEPAWHEGSAAAPARISADAGQVVERPVAEAARPADRLVAAEPAPFGTVQAAFGGADVSDVLAVTGDEDEFSVDADFVDPNALRPGAATSTRATLEAARSALAEPEVEARTGFGLKRGGKSRLQERLDRQGGSEGSTVRKAFLASVTAVALTAGVVGYTQLTDGRGEANAEEAETAVLSALATPAVPASDVDSAALYQTALTSLEAGEATAMADLTRAAEAGEAAAQLHLARFYENGEAGLKADPAQARDWTLRAAEAGEPRAMHNLALYLFDGIGGARDQRDAARWFGRAAEAGLTDSQYNLARLYEDGADGVPSNAGEAYKWYLIAARAGDPQAEAAAERLASRVSDGVRQTARAAADSFAPAREAGV